MTYVMNARHNETNVVVCKVATSALLKADRMSKISISSFSYNLMGDNLGSTKVRMHPHFKLETKLHGNYAVSHTLN